jgi:hypothetical protein
LTTTAWNAEAYRQLKQTLKEHWGDKQAWGRVGGLLEVHRRYVLGYENRRAFARERRINYKTTGDVETAYRANFGLGIVVDEIAPAYGVTPESIGYALDGGQLVPLAPDRQDRPQPQRARPDPGTDPVPFPQPDERSLTPAALTVVQRLGPDMAARAHSYANEINRELRRWTAEYAQRHPDIPFDEIPLPEGKDLFGEGTYAADSWDLHAPELPADELVDLIAALRARVAAMREQDMNVG